MKKKMILAVMVIGLGALNGCFLSGLGWKYIPYIDCSFGDCFFDERDYGNDHDDDGCEWYEWPIDC